MKTEEMVWRKSSRSGGNGGNCVEVAEVPGTTFMRDSKNRDGGVLSFSSDVWGDFIKAVQQDEFTA